MMRLIDHWFTRAECARIFPFISFILLLALQPWLVDLFTALGVAGQAAYLCRCLLALACLFYFRADYRELADKPARAQIGLALLAGVLVFVLWVAPYPVWLGGSETQAIVAMPMQTGEDLFWLACRWAGSALVVPVIEELFWRSYLMRRLDANDFLTVSPAAVTTYAILLSSVLFAVEHQLWFAGLLAGLVYAWLYRHFQVLWVAIIAHVTTNALLGAWVVFGDHWQYW